MPEAHLGLGSEGEEKDEIFNAVRNRILEDVSSKRQVNDTAEGQRHRWVEKILQPLIFLSIPPTSTISSP